MSEYRRSKIAGGSYFFTIVTYQRRPVFDDPGNVELLRAAFRHIKTSRPFDIDAMVVLPDHLHCIWRLPDGDADYSSRWREIKKHLARRIGNAGKRTSERDVWQRRFWEHTIRDTDDWQRHVDYIHYNPVKHGLVNAPDAWPYSSFNKAVAAGWYEANWGQTPPDSIDAMDLE